MGCNPEQPKFTTVAEGKKEIRICEEFAAQFWNQNDLDACGLRIKDGSNDPYIMVPRSLHDNFTAFMNGAFAGRIPGFDASWKIRVVASNAEAEEGTCFAGESGGRLSAGRVGLVICMTMSLGILWVPARIL